MSTIQSRRDRPQTPGRTPDSDIRIAGGRVPLLDLDEGLLPGADEHARSRLTSLRRPTVSVTLRDLRESGELIRLSRSRWPLGGSRPGDRDRVVGLPEAA